MVKKIFNSQRTSICIQTSYFSQTSAISWTGSKAPSTVVPHVAFTNNGVPPSAIVFTIAFSSSSTRILPLEEEYFSKSVCHFIVDLWLCTQHALPPVITSPFDKVKSNGSLWYFCNIISFNKFFLIQHESLIFEFRISQFMFVGKSGLFAFQVLLAGILAPIWVLSDCSIVTSALLHFWW